MPPGQLITWRITFLQGAAKITLQTIASWEKQYALVYSVVTLGFTNTSTTNNTKTLAKTRAKTNQEKPREKQHV